MIPGLIDDREREPKRERGSALEDDVDVASEGLRDPAAHREADPDAGEFRVWATEAGPPSHSVPPHLVAKAALALGKPVFDAIHLRLMHAYFAENRDITDADVLVAIWAEAGLERADLSLAGDPEMLNAVIDQHNEAVRLGVNGVPAVLMAGNDVPITGALPLESYRRWIERALAAA